MKKLLVLGAAAAALPSYAFVSFTGNYGQNFDTLAPSGTPAWADDITLPGWYADPVFPTYEAEDGSTFNVGHKSYGTGLQTDRALGSFLGPLISIGYGVQLRNATSGTITSLTVNYDGEQWRSGNNGSITDLITFDHSSNATSMTSGTWTTFGAPLNFVSPTQIGAGAIDGNLPTNRSTRTGTLNGLNWAPGTDLWLRWTHAGIARDGMSIDDVNLQANPVPEPFTLAFAVAGLGLAGRRRIVKRNAKA